MKRQRPYGDGDDDPAIKFVTDQREDSIALALELRSPPESNPPPFSFYDSERAVSWDKPKPGDALDYHNVSKYLLLWFDLYADGKTTITDAGKRLDDPSLALPGRSPADLVKRAFQVVSTSSEATRHWITQWYTLSKPTSTFHDVIDHHPDLIFCTLNNADASSEGMRSVLSRLGWYRNELLIKFIKFDDTDVQTRVIEPLEGARLVDAYNLAHEQPLSLTFDAVFGHMLRKLVTDWTMVVTPHFATILDAFVGHALTDDQRVVYDGHAPKSGGQTTYLYEVSECADVSLGSLLESTNMDIDFMTYAWWASIYTLTQTHTHLKLTHRDPHVGNVMFMNVNNTVYANRDWIYRLANNDVVVIRSDAHMNRLMKIIDFDRMRPYAADGRHRELAADVLKMFKQSPGVGKHYDETIHYADWASHFRFLAEDDDDGQLTPHEDWARGAVNETINILTALVRGDTSTRIGKAYHSPAEGNGQLDALMELPIFHELNYVSAEEIAEFPDAIELRLSPNNKLPPLLIAVEPSAANPLRPVPLREELKVRLNEGDGREDPEQPSAKRTRYEQCAYCGTDRVTTFADHGGGDVRTYCHRLCVLLDMGHIAYHPD
jgi:hypothetical protein